MTAIRTPPSLLDDYLELKAGGATIGQAADRLGVKPKTIEYVLRRARKAGDQRVLLKPQTDGAYNDLNTTSMTTTNVSLEPGQKLDAATFVGRRTTDIDVYADLLDELGLIPRPATSRADLAGMLSDLLDEVRN